MTTRKNDPVSPIFDQGELPFDLQGLTKREFFAAAALQGLLANKTVTDLTFKTSIAISATEMADLLILHLNRTANEKSNPEEQPQEEEGTEA